MKNLSVDEFIELVNGQVFDVDKAYGVQCVDGIKKFVELVYGEADFNCGECGYAYGLFTNFDTNGCSKYFDKLNFENPQKGDWIIWNKDSKEAPKSHVAMYIEDENERIKVFGQSQNGIKEFNFASVSKEGILGILRPKIYITITPSKKETNYEIALKVINGDFGNGDERKQKLEASGYDYKEVQKEVNKILKEKKANDENEELLLLIKRTMRGDFGNGSNRERILGSNYKKVQDQINKNIKNKTTTWENIKLY